MSNHFRTILKQALVALGIALGLLGAAHAGLVSGRWHPPFGSFLPNLSWSASFDFLAPNACSNQADGDYGTTGNCALGSGYVQQVRLQLYNTSTEPSGYFELGSFAWNIGSVRVKNQQIIGIDTGTSPVAELTYSFDGTNFFSNPSSAMGNTFDLSFGLSGAKLTCLHCVDTFFNQLPPPTDFNLPNIDSSTDGLVQFLITYTSNDTSTPKFTDSNGGALGARLDGSGNYLGQSTAINGPVVASVPEPGALTLVLTALAGVGVASLRRRRRA